MKSLFFLKVANYYKVYFHVSAALHNPSALSGEYLTNNNINFNLICVINVCHSQLANMGVISSMCFQF